MKTISGVWLRARQYAVDMLADCRGIAATEFAVIVPIMLVLFFGTVEFSTGVAVDRKVTIIARTLADLTSQAPLTPPSSTAATINDASLQNFFTAGIKILTPYDPTPAKATVSEIYVDSSQVAKIQWSKAAIISSSTATQATLTASSRNSGDVVTSMVPSKLLVKQTYLILSEVSYRYVPTIGYVMAKAGVNLSDVAYTRSRQAVCVIYNSVPTDPCPTP